MLTLFLFLRHDSVTQSQQTEEGLSLWVSLPNRIHQAVVMKDELWISQLVPGEVYPICFLQAGKDVDKRNKRAAQTHTSQTINSFS